MRAAAHAAVAGASAFGMVTLIKHRHPDARLPDPIFAGVVAVFATALPDYLEPATNPHHRQFFHSAAFATALVALMKKLYDWVPATSGHALVRDILLSIGIGYLAHLGADATTAMGLPLVGKVG